MLRAPTPHNSALPGDFAATVLMPGDPKRSRYIARHYLEQAELVNDIRGVQGYTGYYRNKRVSVMASGMGSPSMAIYAHELYSVYGVEQIIRVGTAGAIADDVQMKDVVAGISVFTDSSFGRHYGFPGQLAPTADFRLLSRADAAAKALGKSLRIGPLYCSDVLYDDGINYDPVVKKLGVVAAEMESAALYLTAMRLGKKALCLCTICEDAEKGLSATSQERQESLDAMIRIALETA